MRSQIVSIALAFGLAVSTASSASFRNGGFEILNPDGPGCSPLGIASNELLAWEVSGGFVGLHNGLVRGHRHLPVDGTHFLVLSAPSRISQTFCTSTGEQYMVCFFLGSFSISTNEAFVTAQVTDSFGAQLASMSFPALPSEKIGFSTFPSSFIFTATTTNSTLSFETTNAEPVSLDAVSVTRTNQPLSVGILRYPVIEIPGPPGAYTIEFTEALGDGAVWKTLSCFRTLAIPYLFIDTSAESSRQRFYRIVALPPGT